MVRVNRSDFLVNLKKSFKREPPCVFDAALFTIVFQVVENLYALFKLIFAEKKLLLQLCPSWFNRNAEISPRY